MTECIEGEVLEKKAVIIASNRGPVSFYRNEQEEIDHKRGSGGLVTALIGLVPPGRCNLDLVRHERR